MKIAIRRERLSDEMRTDYETVFSEQFTVRSPREDDLCQSGYDKGVNDPEEYRRGDCHQACNSELFDYSH
jgi:hypothetical protein